MFTLNGAYIHERQNRAASFAAGTAEHPTGTLNSTSLNASYYYDAHYGLSAGRFLNHGSRDQVLFAAEPGSGSRTGSPDSSGTIIQADWTPFGGKDSWHAPWANARLGLQYTIYDKFNGAAHDYDDFGRSAHDNNTLFLFLWLAI